MSETSNIDDRLVDWLYGELGPDEAARFEAEMDGDPSLKAEAESLQRTRTMVSQLEDAEPPASLSAYLMHTAANEVAKAPPVRESSPGFFATLVEGFRSLGSRPALAAAAALVLVAGVAGVLVAKGDMDMSKEASVSVSDSKPDTATPMTAPPASSAPAPEPVVEGALANGLGQEDSESAGDSADVNAPPPPADEAPSRPEAKREEARVGKLAETKERNVLRRQSNADRRVAKSAPKPVITTSKRKMKGDAKPSGSFAGMPGAMDDFDKAPTNAVSGGDPAARRARSVGLSDGVVATGGAGSAGPRPYKQSQALNDKWAAGRLSALSKSKDCKRAAAIANDILDRNPTFYYRNVRGNKRVTQCQWYVTNELNRRKRVRGKKSAGNADSATAAPRKKRRPAKAPVQADEAYESSAK